MKARKLLPALLILVFTGIGSALAHGGGGHVGVYIGGPYWGPWFYPPSYYQSPVVVVPQSPSPVYIEQQEAPVEAAQHYWYYCRGAKGYYPYVKECPEGWQKVLPQPEK